MERSSILAQGHLHVGSLFATSKGLGPLVCLLGVFLSMSATRSSAIAAVPLSMPAMTTPITHTRAGYCYPSDISFYLNYLIRV